MDLYLMDVNFSKSASIDSFDSLLWTERYNDSGDVTLTLPDTPDTRAMVTEGIFLSIPESREIMLIDTISIEDGIIKATGNTLMDFLKNRMLRADWADGVSNWAIGANPASNIANIIVQYMCTSLLYTYIGVLTAAQGTNEVIPKLTIAPAVPGTSTIFPVPFGSVYDAVKEVCDLDGLGFTLYPPSTIDNTGNITFMTYRGLDRTSSQSTNDPVIFDSAMDSLADVTELRSIANYKNVAWVFPSGASAQSQIGVAYAPGASVLSSWQRRTIMVDASDIAVKDYPTAGDLQKILTQKGHDVLANNNYVRLMDGTIVPQNAYTYGTDYNLGDIIELRNDTAVAQKARVTEYIRAQDTTGERAYPTLSVIS